MTACYPSESNGQFVKIVRGTTRWIFIYTGIHIHRDKCIFVYLSDRCTFIYLSYTYLSARYLRLIDMHKIVRICMSVYMNIIRVRTRTILTNQSHTYKFFPVSKQLFNFYSFILHVFIGCHPAVWLVNV